MSSVHAPPTRRGHVLAVLLLAGCSNTLTQSFLVPPTAAPERPTLSFERGGELVVVGTLRNPSVAAVAWKNVGGAMTEALERTLTNEGGYQVRMDARFAQRAEAAIQQDPARRQRELEKLRDERPEIRYVVVGQVTDFLHTAQLDSSLRQRSILGERAEAVVAIQFDVIDVHVGDVIASDHVVGTASAPKEAPERVYKGVGIDSYVFWSTPLGKASTDAIEATYRTLDRVLAPSDDALAIEDVVGRRRVRVSSGSDRAPVRGGRYFAYWRNPDSSAWEPVYDPATGRAVEVRVESAKGARSEAMVLGEPPLAIDLREVELSPRVPVPLVQPSQWRGSGRTVETAAEPSSSR